MVVSVFSILKVTIRVCLTVLLLKKDIFYYFQNIKITLCIINTQYKLLSVL